MSINKISKTVEIVSIDNTTWGKVYYVTGGYYDINYEISVDANGVMLSSAWRVVKTFGTLLEAIAYLDENKGEHVHITLNDSLKNVLIAKGIRQTMDYLNSKEWNYYVIFAGEDIFGNIFEEIVFAKDMDSINKVIEDNMDNMCIDAISDIKEIQ